MLDALPHDIEAEQAILGACLVRNGTLDKLASLTAGDFFDPVHAALFDAMRSQWQRDRSVNAITLRAVVQDYPDIAADLTPVEYVKRLVRVGDTSNIDGVAAVIRELAARRKLCETASMLQEASMKRNIDVTEAATLAVQGLDEVLSAARSNGRKSRFTMSEAFRDALDGLDADTSNNRISTGLASIDRELGGWRRKQYALIAGRPSMGKTAVAISSMIRTAQSGVGVMFFSLEMPARDLAFRCLSDLTYAHDAQIPYSRASTGDIAHPERERLERAASHFRSLPLVIDEQRGITIAELGARVRAQAQRFEAAGISLGLVMVDYLGLVKASSRYAGNRVHEIGEISDGLATIAKDNNVAVVALQQLNRGVEGRENKRPGLSDLRDSGNLEQDADVVCFVYREAYYLERLRHDPGTEAELRRQTELEACRNTLDLMVAKNRNGATNNITLFTDMSCNAVRDLA